MSPPTATPVDTFDLCGTLPTGRVVLEASAGTGKTYTIAGLVTRYVAEGISELPELLVVTFTRAATAELRDRVRQRLVAAADHLARVAAGADAGHVDEVLAHLAAADRAEVLTRAERVSRALTDFDAATISTIHGFCQHVLTGLGIAADLDHDAELVEDTREVVDAAVDDLLVARFAAADQTPLARRDLVAIAWEVVSNPDARVVPEAAADGSIGDAAAVRVELAHRIRVEVDRRKRRRRQLSYDDLLTRLRDTLRDPDRGPAARATLRSRYRVALIDEFQDTDPIQWDILSAAFGDDGSTLVLIGDPKQAIYSFRGADVYAYLDAVRASHRRATLTTNWRSDGGLLVALDALLDGATFGDPDIRYRRVGCAPGREAPRLAGAPVDRPLRVRVVTRDLGLRTYKGQIVSDVARDHIAGDLAAELVRLLSSDAAILDRDAGGAIVRRERVRPGHVAVLVRQNAEATLVQQALGEVGIPAIINGVGSVFSTAAAEEWRRLLEALERPSSPTRSRAVALTSFVGWRAAELASAEDDVLAALHDRLHGWAAVLRDRGVASLLRTIMVDAEVPGRLLAQRGGERHLTDLEHVGELLHGAAVAEGLGPTALTGWLRERIVEAGDEAVAPDERARRLESDAEAVQILTVHRAKGLEFPIVLAPFLWSGGRRFDPVPVFHDPRTRRRTVDVGGRDGWDGFEEDVERALAEQRGEDLRLLYVALTRARHQAVVWWAPVSNAGWSALGRVLLGRDASGELDSERKAAEVRDERCLEKLHALATRADGRVAVEPVPATAPADRFVPSSTAAPVLDVAAFGRSIDRAWRRTSYSALTSHDAAPRVGSEPDEHAVDDEPDSSTTLPAPVEPTAATLAEAALRDQRLPLGDVPGGTEFGTMVHAVLEAADFTSPTLGTELRDLVQDQLDARPMAVDADVLAAGLATTVATPLGPLADDRPLAAFAADDRLNELDFELPLAGGDDPTGRLRVADIGRLLAHHLHPTDPLAGYPRHLTGAGFHHDVRGYLTGSIDLVLRVRSEDAPPRFLVVDHKTNRLGLPGEPLTAWHYRPEALTAAMIHGDYPLQALLYQVALHRYLRWRLPGYDPAANLGGILYLFVRGMVGPDAPTVDGAPCGVFAWRPRPSLVLALSDLLDAHPEGSR